MRLLFATTQSYCRSEWAARSDRRTSCRSGWSRGEMTSACCASSIVPFDWTYVQNRAVATDDRAAAIPAIAGAPTVFTAVMTRRAAFGKWRAHFGRTSRSCTRASPCPWSRPFWTMASGRSCIFATCSSAPSAAAIPRHRRLRFLANSAVHSSAGRPSELGIEAPVVQPLVCRDDVSDAEQRPARAVRQPGGEERRRDGHRARAPQPGHSVRLSRVVADGGAADRIGSGEAVGD